MAPPISWWRCSRTRAGMREPRSGSRCYPEMPRSRLKASLRSLDALEACFALQRVRNTRKAMADLDWLSARPLAHRGLHDEQNGIIENTQSAFAAAVAARYGIECDLQISGDGEAMVYHDDVLGRLSDGKGRLDATIAGLPRAPPKCSTAMADRPRRCRLIPRRSPICAQSRRV